MSPETDALDPTLTPRLLIRPVPHLPPEGSLRRGLDLLRAAGAAAVAVVGADGGYLGALTTAAIAAAAGRPGFDVNTPVGLLVDAGHPVLRLERGRDGSADLLAAAATLGSAIVLDTAGCYVGLAYLTDQLAPADLAPRPVGAGGMATPRGVYLTTGWVQGGSGNGAILGTGLLLGGLLGAAHCLVGFAAWVAQRLGSGAWYALWLASEAPRGVEVHWLALQAAAVPVFLLLLRSMPLAGYHGAEHKVINAMDQGEPLEPDVVRRMSRVHARCGTNLIAALGLFVGVTQALSLVGPSRLAAMDAALLGAAAAWLLHRRVGPWLQIRFTTREPTDAQIRAAIAAANDLMRATCMAPPTRPTVFRRLWCMGAPQTVVGVVAGLAVVEGLLYGLQQLVR